METVNPDEKIIDTIVLILGPNGSGKDTVQKLLESMRDPSDIVVVSMRSVIQRIALIVDGKNLLTREEITDYATEKRRETGKPEFFMEEALVPQKNVSWYMVNSFRHPREYYLAKRKNAKRVVIIGVLPYKDDASSVEKVVAYKKLYERIQIRKSSTDDTSFEEFINSLEEEWSPTNPADPSVQNIQACFNLIEPGKNGFILINDGSLEELETQLKSWLGKMQLIKSVLS